MADQSTFGMIHWPWRTKGNVRSTILVISKSPERLNSTEIPLRQSGYNVVTSGDGRKSLELAAASRPDLIINDVAATGMAGAGLCILLKRNPELDTIPILLLAEEDTETQKLAEGLEAGAEDYLTTPFERELLVLKVARMIARRDREADLRRQVDHLQSLVENSTDIIFVTDENGVALYGNPSVERLLGYNPGELIGGNSFDLVHPEDRARVIEKFKEGLQGDLIGPDIEYRLRHKDGSWRVLESSGRRFVDLSGRLSALINTRDITDRRLAEESARSREAYLAETQRLTHIGSFEYDIAAGEWNWSDELYRIVGLSPQRAKLSDAMIAEYFGTSGSELISRVLEKAESGNQPFSCEIPLRRPEEATRTLHARVLVVRDQLNAPRRIIGTAQDVTEQKQMEEALRQSRDQALQSQKMEALGQLAGGVAHDFNNLLTVIMGYSEFLYQGLNPAHPLRFCIDEIKSANERAASLTRQLLAFSRRQLLQPRVINLNEIIAELANMLSRIIGETIELSTALSPNLGNVEIDPGQVEQVILNLAVNARDAMPLGGRLVIGTYNVRLEEEYVGTHLGLKTGDYVMIVVSDTGCGMDAETKARVFEPFFTTKGAGKGTGLGLSTAYGIVKQSGGSIWVYSEVGKGTTFKIYLPRSERDPDECNRGVVRSEASGGIETILLVEDEQTVRDVMRKMLEEKGYQVLAADNGRAAIQLCEAHHGRIHLLLTDVVMPELGGAALGSHLLKLHPGLRVLYMSGHIADATLPQDDLHNEAHFIQKPFSPGALLQKVREVLDLRSQ